MVAPGIKTAGLMVSGACCASPSISQDRACQPQLEQCADWIVAEMRRIGLENARKLPTAGHPVVYADWLRAGAGKPTILIYAHYDVQPVGDAALWESPPFEPTVTDGRLVARGAVDDKCGIWINLKAIEAALAASGALPGEYQAHVRRRGRAGLQERACFHRRQSGAAVG